MTMKITKLTTSWSPEEASAVIEFLDTLSEQLMTHYGESIIKMHTDALEIHDPDQEELDFDDELEIEQ